MLGTYLAELAERQDAPYFKEMYFYEKLTIVSILFLATYAHVALHLKTWPSRISSFTSDTGVGHPIRRPVSRARRGVSRPIIRIQTSTSLHKTIDVIANFSAHFS